MTTSAPSLARPSAPVTATRSAVRPVRTRGGAWSVTWKDRASSSRSKVRRSAGMDRHPSGTAKRTLAVAGPRVRLVTVTLKRRAVPVGAPETCAEFQEEADEAICALTPEPFHAVGLWYTDFSQTTDEEVRELLELASADRAPVGNST